MMQSNDTIHKFELANMGKAPFKIVGFFKLPSASSAEANPLSYQEQLKVMPKGFGIGSCTFCGIGLINNYLIESSDGKKSAVGCDCVKKVGDKGLTTQIKEMQRIARREAREAKRQADYEAKMAAQRQANGGKTNAEIQQEKLAARDNIIIEGKALIKQDLKEIGMALKNAYGDFAQDLSHMLRYVDFPRISPNMQRIAVEIATKQITGARKNSKAYKIEHERIDAIMKKARADYDALLEKADNLI